MTRSSSKRTLNQAVRKLRDRASELGLPRGMVNYCPNQKVCVYFDRLVFCVCEKEPLLMPPGAIWLNYRDDSSMKSAIEELKKAAAHT